MRATVSATIRVLLPRRQRGITVNHMTKSAMHYMPWLLLAGACASPSPSAVEAPAPSSSAEPPPLLLLVEHRADECTARSARQRCVDPTHWLCRLDDRPMRDAEELREHLRQYARRFPDPDDTRFSSVMVTLQAETDAPYVAVRQAMQIGAEEGISKYDCQLAEATQAAGQPTAPPVQNEPLPPASNPLRIDIRWDEATQHSVVMIGRHVVCDDADVRAALKAVPRPDGDDRPRVCVHIAPLVPWCDVSRIVRLARSATFEIEFVLEAPGEPRDRAS